MRDHKHHRERIGDQVLEQCLVGGKLAAISPRDTDAGSTSAAYPGSCGTHLREEFRVLGLCLDEFGADVGRRRADCGGGFTQTDARRPRVAELARQAHHTLTDILFACEQVRRHHGGRGDPPTTDHSGHLLGTDSLADRKGGGHMAETQFDPGQVEVDTRLVSPVRGALFQEEQGSGRAFDRRDRKAKLLRRSFKVAG